MLDFAPSPDTRPRSMLSLDFSPYLLSASPPSSGFSLDSLSLTSNYSPYSFFSSSPSRPPSACTKVYGPSFVKQTPPLKSIMSMNSKDISSSNETSRASETSSVLESSSQSCRHIKPGRHVSFADEVGKPLAEVRLLLDNPTAPPLLTFRGVPDESRPGSGLSDDDDENSHPVFLAPDPQPLAKVNFEENLCRNLMAVENVLVDNYNLTCTVLIKSRPSSKRVFGRYTLDSWHSFQDLPASFISVARPGYDRYKFVLTVPSSTDRSHPVQFAVCFEANGVQHWDNNEGKDFCVHWIQKLRGTEDCHFGDRSSSTMDFSGLISRSRDDPDQPYY